MQIYLVNSFKNFSQTYRESVEAQKTEQFNAEFTALSTRENVSMHEILTLTNYANEFNFINDLDTDDEQFINIKIEIKGKTINLTDLETELKKMSEYKKKSTDEFITDLLDGTYVKKYYPNITYNGETMENDGKYKYDYDEDTNEKIYYNCYKCTDFTINSLSNRYSSITFTYQNVIK